jgi:hypothetical protein
MEAQRSTNFNEFLTNFKVQNEECHYYVTLTSSSDNG